MFQTDYPITFNPERASLQDLRKYVADVVGVVVSSISTPDHQTEHVLNVMKILCAVCGRQHWLLTDAMKLLNCTGYNISLQGNYLEHMFPTGDYYYDEKKMTFYFNCTAVHVIPDAQQYSYTKFTTKII